MQRTQTPKRFDRSIDITRDLRDKNTDTRKCVQAAHSVWYLACLVERTGCDPISVSKAKKPDFSDGAKTRLPFFVSIDLKWNIPKGIIECDSEYDVFVPFQGPEELLRSRVPHLDGS